ncbi:MAG TPA: TIGR00296 family protein [Thermoplasmata archaeon]|nr:TIGR00296 family protein [Thermoplasmata archaeon]
MLGDHEGEAAVRLARRSVEKALGVGPTGPSVEVPRSFDQPRGVFVTLKRHPDGRLRGCVGYPLAVLPLRSAVSDAAVSAACDDPRFPSVSPSELPRLTFEVSILTVPVPVPGPGPEAIARAIHVGRDGLIIESGGRSGLLLPQVALEQGWTAEEFLDGACEKAGLSPGAWRSPAVRVRRFEAEVFHEREPSGRVERSSGGASPTRERPGPRR